MAFGLVTLGPVALHDADGTPVDLPAGKPLALLVYLALSGRRSGRDELARLLWPQSEPSRARQSVRHALWRLRQAMGEDILAESDPAVLKPDLVRSDYEAVLDHLDRDELDEAHALVGGEFLVDLSIPDAPAWTTWAEDTGSRLRARLSHAFSSRGLQARAAGRSEAALDDLHGAVAYAPYRPSSHAALIETLLDLSRLDEAAVALERARTEIGDLAGSELAALSARLDSLVAKNAHRAGGERQPVPFVGRDRDLASLLSTWRLVVAGTPRVALVAGETGIGKTRLAEEVRRQVEVGGGAVVWGQAREPEQAMDWAVAAELARHLISMPGAAGISAGSDRLIRALVPSLAAGEPASAGPGDFAASLAEAFRDLLGAVAYETPLLVVVENAHWADSASLALLHRAIRQLEDDPVLLLLTRQTEAPAPDLERVAAALDRHGVVHFARLRPLDRSASTAILQAMTTPESLAGSRTGLGDRFHEVTGGVPRFLFSAVEPLRAQGHATLVDGRYRLAPSAAANLTLPVAARAVLFSRLDHLSDGAGRIAAALAARGGTGNPDLLGRVAGLGDRTDEAIAELRERGVIRPNDDGPIAFAHPLLAGEATRRFTAPRAPSRLRRGALAAVLVLVFAAATVAALARGIPSGPPYGGGTLYVHTSNAVLAAPARPGTSIWRAEPVEGAPPTDPESELLGPFRVTNGELLWYRKMRHPDGPYIARAFPDGSNRTVIRTPGDDNLGMPSPDGRFLVYRTENLDTDRYDLDLYVARADGSQPRRIYAGREKLDYPRWSPDGRRIAFRIAASRDSLAVVTPGGERVRTFTFDGVHQTSWCGGSRFLVSQIRRGGRPEVVLLDVASDSIRFVGRGTWPTCSPDGQAVAYLALVDGELQPRIQEIRTGDHIDVELQGAVGDEVNYLLWVPDAIGPVASEVEAIHPGRMILVGARVPLEARVRFSDGRVRPEPLAWTSLDPAVAFVDPDGVLYANREGHARITADYRGWLADTLQVAVRPGGPQAPLLADPLTRLDTARWAVVGEPEPEVVTSLAGPMLALRGDGRYWDGIMTRKPLVIGRGVTVEVEFRMDLTRRSQQRITIGLTDAPDAGRLPVELHRPPQRGAIGVQYPAAELLKFDPTALQVYFRNGYQEYGRVPDRLPGDGWVHLALQVDASGAVEVFVDRESVLETDLRLPIDTAEAWYVDLAGAAVNTDLLVRNLVVWEGLRYGS